VCFYFSIGHMRAHVVGAVCRSVETAQSRQLIQFDGKDLVEGGIPVQLGGDPGLAQRVATLESLMAQLTHFIPENLRPDLTQGALKQEPDLSQTGAKPETPADTKTAGGQEKSEEGNK
jgi:hypothetical protein